jgi:hypothetical protein
MEEARSLFRMFKQLRLIAKTKYNQSLDSDGEKPPQVI